MRNDIHNAACATVIIMYVVSENYGLLGSNDIHNASCAAVAKVIDLLDNRPFCPIVEKSTRPLGHFERKMADRRPLYCTLHSSALLSVVCAGYTCM